MGDVDINSINKDGTFVDDQGREQIAVSLESIFGMVGGGKPKQPQTQRPKDRKRPPIKRGIKTSK